MLDLFPKIPTDLSQSTVLGGWFSTVTGVLMLLLFQVELFAFISAPIESQVVMDTASETKVRHIDINDGFMFLASRIMYCIRMLVHLNVMIWSIPPSVRVVFRQRDFVDCRVWISESCM